MPWRLVGSIAALLFAALAVPAWSTPDAPLPSIVLVVFPAELALMTVMFEVPDAPLPPGWVPWAPRPVVVEAASLFLVAGWAAALLFLRPHAPEA